MRNEILMKVKMIEPQLTAVQKKIARFILENSKAVVSMTVSDLAIQSDASEPSVFRFLKQIDYESYQLFRIDLAQSLATKNTATIYGDIEEADTTTMIKKKVVASTISAITELEDVLDDDSIEAGATSIITARRIIIVGIGASVSIASDLFHKLLQLGFDVVYSENSHIMNMLATQGHTDDLLIAISHSGESSEILDAVGFAKEKGLKTIALTSYTHSTLAKQSDILLLSSSQETLYRSDSMISRINQLIIIDMLYIKIVLQQKEKVLLNITQSRKAVAKNKT